MRGTLQVILMHPKVWEPLYESNRIYPQQEWGTVVDRTELIFSDFHQKGLGFIGRVFAVCFVVFVCLFACLFVCLEEVASCLCHKLSNFEQTLHPLWVLFSSSVKLESQAIWPLWFVLNSNNLHSTFGYINLSYGQ